MMCIRKWLKSRVTLVTLGSVQLSCRAVELSREVVNPFGLKGAKTTIKFYNNKMSCFHTFCYKQQINRLTRQNISCTCVVEQQQIIQSVTLNCETNIHSTCYSFIVRHCVVDIVIYFTLCYNWLP